MAEYMDKLREHSFDDIQEFDNRLPQWWLWSFYLACIFAAIYWMYYHGTGVGHSATERYEAALAAKTDADAKKAAASKPITREDLLAFAADKANVEAGKALFTGGGTCFACHLANGTGTVGPNLTDKFWIHGGRIEQIYKTVTEVAPAKGMAAWKPILGDEKCKQLVAFVMTLKNKNLPGKAPEGTEEK